MKLLDLDPRLRALVSGGLHLIFRCPCQGVGSLFGAGTEFPHPCGATIGAGPEFWHAKDGVLDLARITLLQSIRVTGGCAAHFNITDGEILAHSDWKTAPPGIGPVR